MSPRFSWTRDGNAKNSEANTSPSMLIFCMTYEKYH